MKKRGGIISKYVRSIRHNNLLIFHLHSYFSDDGVEPAEDMVKRGIDMAVEAVVEDVIEEVTNNAAVKNNTVELPGEVVDFTIELAKVEVAEGTTPEAPETPATVVTEISYTVTPSNAAGEKVSKPTESITFRLPVPSNFASEKAKVIYNGTELDDTYEVKTENGAKYVEV